MKKTNIRYSNVLTTFFGVFLFSFILAVKQTLKISDYNYQTIHYI